MRLTVHKRRLNPLFTLTCIPLRRSAGELLRIAALRRPRVVCRYETGARRSRRRTAIDAVDDQVATAQAGRDQWRETRTDLLGHRKLNEEDQSVLRSSLRGARDDVCGTRIGSSVLMLLTQSGL